MSLSGAQIVARALKQQGVTVVFGIVGIPVVEVAEAIQSEGIRFISFRNEQSCSYAASAWGYLNQKPGVCLVVSGPGVVHALAGVVHSQVNTWPLVLIGGSCETTLEGAGAFQECLQIEMCRPYSKYSARPQSVEQIPQVMTSAFRHAMVGRPGAAYIDLPADYIQGSVQAAIVPNAHLAKPVFAQADPTDIVAAVELLSAAKSPLIVVGKGAAYARAEEEIRALVDKYQAPFLPTPMAKGVVPDSHPRNASSARSSALKGADVVLLLGARLNWILHFGRRFNPNAKIIQVDVHPEEIGTNVSIDVALQGHLPLVVRQLLDALRGPFVLDPDSNPFVSELVQHAQRNADKQLQKYQNSEIPMSYYRAFYEIKQQLPSDVVFVSEGANTMDIARTVFDFQLPRRRLDCATFANMGVGMGFAIAAQLHYVESRVVAVVGDSAFGFSAMELETAVRSRLPLIVIVINNNGIYYGLEPEEYGALERQSQLPTTALLPGVRYELIAEAVGAKGVLVKTPEDLGTAVEAALAHNGLTLINCVIKPGGYQKLDFAWMSK
ncbi:putative 2-hydroxyphytanoyl-CoA lyase [Coemansia reversa NRRL 1564]|uniref:2-hydroxyacyl-CoA lyase n=1 Tax=Coemansia reversa (strain ATCC 12441 / NRRL 1564) TaxID=763665 RepID=A0A2G5BIK7_COERN|nr:putative 2-hydroxyphytanoyl-CoA lyase [Coemansia reversa NRRL 1564]|eukprot:PIA18836.1 putative 2-hydroxyphytanoyl-CoA lyase [Coemansia reversa NRRL 1564]